MMLFQVITLALGLVPHGQAAALSLRTCPTTQASLPQNDCNPAARAAAIVTKRQNFNYGPSLIGDASFFPNGSLADSMVLTAEGQFEGDEVPLNAEIQSDLELAEVAVGGNGGLNSLEDYSGVLYTNQWKSSIPGGEDPGILTNYTQDLLFSMERLSLNPYTVKRISPFSSAPFTIPDSTVFHVTGYLTLELLILSGNLFVADHSYQAKYPTTARYGAACTALFFIHLTSQDFLPLAIKTNVGMDLVYTPLDLPNDWLLAKMMFNENDLFHAQMYHLVASHDVGEIVHEAAVRTLSDSHPVLVLLTRLMYQAYALRPIGSAILFNPGGAVDQFFYINSTGALDFVHDFYPTAGAFRANYLEIDLKSRGLLEPSFGFPLKSFPFYSDACTIRSALQTFMTTFVNAYYTTPLSITEDLELKAWFAEANGAAQVIDFPSKPNKATLIAVLTHFAFLTGVAHHTLNTGDPAASLATLPFHPAALFQPIPTAKGVTNIVPFLPPVPAALGQVDLFAGFNRPMLAATNRTLAYAFSDPGFLGVLNAHVEVAASTFLAAMKSFSAVVSGRTFDGQGLSQGMPFVWKGLDPGVIPFYFAV